MRRRTAVGTTAIALASVVIIAVAAIGTLIVTTRSSQDTQPNLTSTQSTTTSDAPTYSTSDTTTGITNSTVCIINVEGAGTYLRIVSDSTQQPLAGISVSVLPAANSCFGASRPGPATYTTNATGWVSVGGMQANYYFDVSVGDAGRSYNFSLPQGPLDTTNATLSLPSGSLSITLCYTMATANPCRPYTGSATTASTTTGVASTASSLLAECPGGQSSGSGFGTVITGTASPAMICVQLYYYNLVAPMTLDLSGALTIQAVQYIPNGSVDYPRSFDGASNFTIATSQPQLVMGGPANESEGTVVAFTVTARAGASGTYELGLFTSSGLGAYMLGAQEPESCGYYGQLVAGDGQPNYAQLDVGCITYDTSSTGLIAVPGIPYPLAPGFYFRIISVTNSTG